MRIFLFEFNEADNKCFSYGLSDTDSNLKTFFYSEFKVSPSFEHQDIQDTINYCRSIRQEFTYLTYSETTQELMVANDFLGKQTLYYYYDDGLLLVSNSFWDIVRRLKLKIKVKINPEFIRQTAIYNISLENDTVIKGIKTLEPSTLITYKHRVFSKQAYDEINFKPNENLKLDDVVDETDNLFRNYFAKIKKYHNDEVFGIGLSGGLDSRIIAKLALDSKIQLSAYCVGQKHSLFGFKTYGYLLSKKMAKKLNIKSYRFINYKDERYSNKVIDDVYLFPNKSSNINIASLSKLPDFKVMLNGEHGGVFFGEFDFKELASHNVDSMPTYLLSFLSFNDGMDMLLNDGDYQSDLKKVSSIISSYSNNERYNIFYRFFFEMYASKSKGGFFESCYFQKERFTPFLDRDFFDFFLTWPTYLRFSKLVQYRYINKYFPEMSTIPDENLDAPVKYRKDKPLNWGVRFCYALRNKLFCQSLNIKKWILKDKENRDFYNEMVGSNKEFIAENYPYFSSDKFFEVNPRSAMNLAKLLLVKRVIEQTDCSERQIKAFLKNEFL
ncbi:asparagine synthase-related protein [Pseudoalteromonas phenolica]|uniref:asparagine synthase-related protein n=1 Tax=Pseudoalteromonas phenolica TaxID=161398 RepID=UPI00110AD49D|nr:asparagine synthase-related protein [Pseudoalteromonas phenolica]TMO51927.1 hypothetical protein CWC21_22225 [Pseudoalteromonas phenolica]